MAFPPATPVVDGTTVIGNAWWTAFLAELTSALQDAGHPTVTPAAAIAELITARGSLASVNARMNFVVGQNGENLSTTTPPMIRNGIGYGNASRNGTFALWSRGDALAPDYWALSGTGAAIARCGIGLADTKVITGQDHFSAKLTFGSDPARLTQYIAKSALQISAWGPSKYIPVDASAVNMPGYDTVYDGVLEAYVISHVWCDGSNRARLYATGGLGNSFSEYHPGDSQWHTLITPVEYGNSISYGCSVESAGAAYFQCVGIVFIPSTMKPMWMPENVKVSTYTFPVIATPAAATGYGWFQPPRPGLALGLTAMATGAVPTGGTTLKLDLMTPVGGTFVSMFSTLPTFVASDRQVIQACDPAAANYRRRCMRGFYAAGSAFGDSSIVRLDVNTRDSGNTGTNIVATFHYLEWAGVLDRFRSMTDVLEAA